MVQRSDDSGRNLRGVWLGPENAFRWPFDATYTEWFMGFVMVAPAFVVLWLVIPFGLVVGFLGWLVAGWIAHNGNVGFGSARVRRWTWIAVILALAGLLFPNLMTWALPMPWWLAVPSAVAAAVIAVRAARPYLDGNRPLAYWINTLSNIASGPRPVRPVAVITPEGFATIDGHDTELSDDLWRFMNAINNADPTEAPVRNYRQRSPEVEAVYWDIGSGDENTGHNILAWLRSKGLEVKVSNVVYTSTPGKGNHPASADVDLDGKRLPQSCVIFLHKDNPQNWGTRTVADFNIEFEEVPLAVPSPR
jgi:hypothetical protein